MTRRLASIFGLIALACAAPAGRAAAAEAPTDAAKREAKERFDRGLKRFDEGDSAGALAELTKAYELVPSAIVLYDLALVHASLGHAVQAVDVLERLFAAPPATPSGLSADERAHAERLLAEQSARVGEIAIRCDVDGARVSVDNLDVGVAPLPKPLRVTAGTHVIGVIATGRIPSRRAITVAGKARETADFALAPLDVAPAQLTIATRLAEVEVAANGAPLGRTPFASTLPLAPGSYTIALRRPGYRAIETTLVLAAGGAGSVALEPAEDAEALAAIGGSLEPIVSEPGAEIAIDGRARGPAQVVRLAPGEHQVRVERSGFLPIERAVVIETGKLARVRFELAPTAEHLLGYQRSARAQRTWGWSLVGGGALIAGLGAGFLAWNVGRKADASAAYEAILFESALGAGRSCDPRTVRPASCKIELDAKYDAWRSTASRDLYGWIGVGVGAAATLTGVFVLLRADDPARWQTTGYVVPGGGGFVISGRF